MNLLKGAQREAAYRAVNPMMALPALIDGEGPILFELLAIIEYLDETHPNPPLLPRDAWGRARVRGLAQIVACDLHPLIVPRVREYLEHEFKLDAGLPKRRAADTYPCDASWPGPSWPCMSLDRYTQSTLNAARHAKKSEVEGEIESQIEYQEVQEGQASSAAQAAEGCCQHSGAGGCCNESSRLRSQARSRRSGVKRRRGATSF